MFMKWWHLCFLFMFRKAYFSFQPKLRSQTNDMTYKRACFYQACFVHFWFGIMTHFYVIDCYKIVPFISLRQCECISKILEKVLCYVYLTRKDTQYPTTPAFLTFHSHVTLHVFAVRVCVCVRALVFYSVSFTGRIFIKRTYARLRLPSLIMYLTSVCLCPSQVCTVHIFFHWCVL